MPRPATDNNIEQPRPTIARIGVTGCMGRVGTLIVREILAGHHAGAALAGGTVKPNYPDKADFFITHKPEELFERSDVVIDFTTPEATRQHLWLAAKHRVPLIVGTTGLDEVAEKEIKDAAKETAILRSANMSVGVNLLLALVEQTAARLSDEWDIEILETHHKHKVDAPSGTALALGKAALAGRKVGAFVTPDRTGERLAGDIGYAVRRGGDVIGEHVVSFYGAGERLELSHTATDRSLFAKGAIRAAVWIKDRPKGLYTMRDVLGL